MTTTLNQGLLRRESHSLRVALHNAVTVPDRANADRPVPAYFRMGEEDRRTRQYPYILIDAIGYSRDPSREHRGPFYVRSEQGYFPMGVPEVGTVARTDLPIPMLARFQVATYVRFQRQHLLLQVGLMQTPPLRPRFGALDMAPTDDPALAPDDYSVRRVDILEGPTPQDAFDDEGKRLFSARWTIEISSELFEAPFDASSGEVQTVHIDPPTQVGFQGVDFPVIFS